MIDRKLSSSELVFKEDPGPHLNPSYDPPHHIVDLPPFGKVCLSYGSMYEETKAPNSNQLKVSQQFLDLWSNDFLLHLDRWMSQFHDSKSDYFDPNINISNIRQHYGLKEIGCMSDLTRNDCEGILLGGMWASWLDRGAEFIFKIRPAGIECIEILLTSGLSSVSWSKIECRDLYLSGAPSHPWEEAPNYPAFEKKR